MLKICVLILLLATLALAASGCKAHSGSKEFIPGKGWVPTD